MVHAYGLHGSVCCHLKGLYSNQPPCELQSLNLRSSERWPLHPGSLKHCAGQFNQPVCRTAKLNAHVTELHTNRIWKRNLNKNQLQLELAFATFPSRPYTRTMKLKNIKENQWFAGTCIRLISAVAVLFGLTAASLADEVVNVYSARQENLIKPLLERFTEQTHIDVNLVTGKADALLKRLQVEGSASPADVFITVDAGRLHRAKEAGVLQPVTSPVLEQRIPPSLRDSENYWFGLSKRARVIVYAKAKVNAEALTTYEALTDAQWKGRICIRSSSNIYNQSLVSSLIAAHGIEATQRWADGLVANFAKPPAGGDTDQIKAVGAGVCDLAIVNTYYFARLIQSDDPQLRAMAATVAVHFPNQNPGERGAHINVSGAGVTASTKNRGNAVKLIEFLASQASQTWYAEVNNEYPVVEGVATPELLRSFGEFRADPLNLTLLGANNRAAVKIMDRAKWR